MSSPAEIELSPQIITNPPDDEHISMLARTGLYLPTVACRQPLSEGKEPLEINVNYANLAQGASTLDIRSPIVFDLITSTVSSRPTVRINRTQPSSQVILPIPVEFTSATVQQQHMTDARFWLSAIAASRSMQKSPKRPFDLEQPHSAKKLRNTKLLTVGALAAAVSPLFIPESQTLGLASIATFGTGGWLSARKLCSIVPTNEEYDRRSDIIAARYLKNPLIRSHAGRLATKYPVLELQV